MTRAKLVTKTGPILSDRAHDVIKTDILAGLLEPGEKLQLDNVSERYGIGTAPVREALNRLSAEGWVERHSQRGFFVSDLSYSELEELVKTRIWLETLALRESIANGKQDWEDTAILSYHRLARTDRFLNPTDTEERFTLNPDWEIRHHDFHSALLAASGSELLEHFCAQMMERAIRYRNLSVKFNLARRGDALVEHEAILTAALDRDVDLAVQLLTEHYRLTLDGLRARLFEDT